MASPVVVMSKGCIASWGLVFLGPWVCGLGVVNGNMEEEANEVSSIVLKLRARHVTASNRKQPNQAGICPRPLSLFLW